MRNLLSAGFHRLKKDKIFWAGLIIMLMLSAGTMAISFSQAFAAVDGNRPPLDEVYWVLTPVLSIFYAVFSSLFIGTEYSEGTIRNKIAVGQKRIAIYLSNYIICFTVGLLLVVVWLIGGLIGVPVFGFFKMRIQDIFIYLGTILLFTAAWTGILMLLCMLSANKAVTAVMALLLILLLLIIGSMLYNSLSQPEFYDGVIVTAEGLKQGDPMPNPNFVRGTKRVIYQFLVDCLPSSQAILIANAEIKRPVLSLICSLLIAVMTTAVGIWGFSKKDIK